MQQLSDRLGDLANGKDEIERIEADLTEMATGLKEKADVLSANRQRAILVAETQLTQILSEVGMPNSRIKIVQTKTDTLHKDGTDEISMMFSANSGQPEAPVGKVASGGELSRLMLAIKSVMARHTALPTLIFDEIDTGISGETAVRVGNVIADLQKNMQVICITHLPQIASKGEAHYYVYKQENEGKTNTGIRKLYRDERIQVIAEMLGGKEPGQSALEHAKELLDKE
jgi:DNA repair protein RecN (Recombination protein N)